MLNRGKRETADGESDLAETEDSAHGMSRWIAVGHALRERDPVLWATMMETAELYLRRIPLVKPR
jgi:hypothetical protein